MELRYPPLAVDCRFDSNCPTATKCTIHVGYSTLSTQFRKTESLLLNPVCCELSSQFSTSAQSHRTSALLSTHSIITFARANIYTSESSSTLQSPNRQSSHRASVRATSLYKSLKVSWSFCFVRCNSIVSR